MTEICAFIGHSFDEKDAGIVNAFLKYFTQLRSSLPNFSWEHAEAAEPKELAEKVLRLIEDKNVFIGICTRRERVIEDGKLKRSVFFSGSVRAPLDNFEWKTSDWVIQEIGLARGRSLTLVLLIETNVRPPGGLQGNVEYIPFDREAPEKSFGKILEMMSALSPRKSESSSAESAAAPPEMKQDKPTDVDGSWFNPTPSWTREDYEFAFLRAVVFEKAETAEEISEAYLATEMGAEPRNAEGWRAYGLFTRMRYGDAPNLLPVIKEMATQAPENVKVLRHFAQALDHYGQYDEAARVFRAAASKTGSVLLKILCLKQAAAIYNKSGKLELANEIVGSMRGMASNEGEEEQILFAQKDSAESRDDDDLYLASIERIVDLEPDNKDERFALAYKYSALGHKDLAALHYSLIPEPERSDSTWNNFGAALARLDLQTKSVLAYRKASDMGSTLAMSNLAEKFLNAGFLEEATSICDVALANPNRHKNVGHTVSRLTEIPEDEEKREKDAFEKARPVSEFFRIFGRASVRDKLEALSGKWQGPDAVLDASLAASGLQLMGEYEQESVDFLGMLRRPTVLGSLPLAQEEQRARYRVEYTAASVGRAFAGRVRRTQIGAPAHSAAALLGAAGNEVKVLLVLSDDLQRLDVMEKPEGKELRRYELKRISD